MKNLKQSIALVALILLTSLSAKAQISTTDIDGQVVAPVSKADYMNLEMEAKIKAFLISGKIPASLPKYVSGTKQEYSKIVKDWAKDNLDLIKPEYHSKITGKAEKPKSRKEHLKK